MQPFNAVELIVLQGNSFCNLNCRYCDLSVESRRATAVMPMELVAKLFDDLFRSGRLAPQVTIVWHSGEPLTLPPSYYDEAIGHILDLNETLSGGSVSVSFKIQTNAVLINEDWCAFFKRHRAVLDIGISCDGPASMHDAYRRNWNGRATHAQTARGMELLQKHGIPYKIIAVVTPPALSDPDTFFDYFHERRDYLSGFHFNILAEAHSDDPTLAYSAADRTPYYNFYRRLLARTSEADEAGMPFKIANFSQALARIMAAQAPGAPLHFLETSAPLKSLSVDARGNVTTFYAGLGIDVLQDLYGDGKGLSIGNILETPFETMVQSAKLQAIIQDFAISTRACKETCEYFSVCPGGYEVTKKRTLGTFAASETAECAIHVKALVDAVLDDIDDHLNMQKAGELTLA